MTSAGFKKFGYTDSQLLNIGSPRFDEYKAMRSKPRTDDHSFTIAFVIPAISPYMWSDSYEVQDYIRGIAAATAAIPGAIAICKLRPVEHNKDFYLRVIPEAFGKTPYRIAQYEPLVDIIGKSDAVVTIHSTTVYEGLISGRPLIYNASLEFHRALGEEFKEYAREGVLEIANTNDELKNVLVEIARDETKRTALVQRADEFMQKNYAFDGNASARLAENIRSIVASHGSSH